MVRVKIKLCIVVVVQLYYDYGTLKTYVRFMLTKL